MSQQQRRVEIKEMTIEHVGPLRGKQRDGRD
jgi:hypothetical protein